jgi:hypothetical protein
VTSTAARSVAFELGDHGVAAGHHLGEALAVRGAVTEQLPAWPLGRDLGSGTALVAAVVHLPQSVDHVGLVVGQHQRSRVGGASQGTAEHEGIVAEWAGDGQAGCHQRAQVPCLALAGGVEGQVGAPGVAAETRPLGRPVADDEDELRRRKWHGGRA